MTKRKRTYQIQIKSHDIRSHSDICMSRHKTKFTSPVTGCGIIIIFNLNVVTTTLCTCRFTIVCLIHHIMFCLAVSVRADYDL